MHVQKVLLDANTMKDMFELASKAQSHVSFFGCRYVTIDNYEGALPLNQLGVHFLEISSTTRDVAAKEKYWSKIDSKIRKIYELSDKQAFTWNLITYIFTMIRDTLTITNEGAKGRRFKFDF